VVGADVGVLEDRRAFHYWLGATSWRVVLIGTPSLASSLSLRHCAGSLRDRAEVVVVGTVALRWLGGTGATGDQQVGPFKILLVDQNAPARGDRREPPRASSPSSSARIAAPRRSIERSSGSCVVSASPVQEVKGSDAQRHPVGDASSRNAGESIPGGVSARLGAGYRSETRRRRARPGPLLAENSAIAVPSPAGA
jgi:hypothetical protein